MYITSIIYLCAACPVIIASALLPRDVGFAPSAAGTYYSTALINGQTLPVFVDTGSPFTWCYSQGFQGATNGRTLLTYSTPEENDFDVNYGGGAVHVAGKLTHLTFSFAGYEVQNFQIGLAKNDFGGAFPPGISCFVGLSYNPVHLSNDLKTTFFDAVQPQLPQKKFAVDMKKDSPGSYRFGSIQTSDYSGTLSSATVVAGDAHWTLLLTAYHVGSGSPQTLATSFRAGIDNGAGASVGLPQEIITAYNSAKGSGCPSLTLTFGGGQATLLGDAIGCGSNLEVASGSGLLGPPLFLSSYVVFDQAGTVSFAAKS